jgi:RNA polymerase sigma-70 factor (ECF subfamily)
MGPFCRLASRNPFFLINGNKNHYNIVVIGSPDGGRNVNEDAKVVERLKRGEEKAFEEVYRKYGRKVYNLALRYCQDVQIAEDIAQESFIRVYRYIASYNEAYSFSGWLMRIVVNLCKSYRKDQSKDVQKVINYQHVIRRAVDDPATKTEITDALQYYLEQMDDTSKTMMILYYLQDFSYEEISEMLDCPLGTVKSRLSRSREKFHELVSRRKEGTQE